MLKPDFMLLDNSRFFRRIGAWLRPSGYVRLAEKTLQLKVGDKSFSTSLSFPSDLAPSQESALVVSSLLGLLADQSLNNIGSLHLVASDRWLRPFVFPLSDDALADEDIEVLVEHQFQQLFGKFMTGWVWRWDRQPNGQVIAMAWPDQLVNVLRAKLAEQRIHLVSALPLSLYAIKKIAQCPSNPVWFIVAETGCVTFVRQEKKGWLHWRVCSLPELTADLVMLQFMRMVTQLEDDCHNIRLIETDSDNRWAIQLRSDLAAAGWDAKLLGAVQ